MNGVTGAFRPKHKTLIGYLTVGYPDIATTLKAVPLLEKAGCDMVELGIPFSDPIGDGPVIQAASFQALENGVTPVDCIELARQLRQKVNIPLVFMGYYNPILSYGLVDFCRQSATAGVNGLIVPDLPPDESGALDAAAADNGLDLIHLLAPTSTAERIELVAAKSRGFIYLVSVAGVTGAREGVPEYLPGFVAQVRRQASQPLAIGFGVSSPAQAAAMAGLADGVIIGSKLIKLIDEDPSLGGLETFVRQVRQALDAAGPD
ncbi:MAG: tryptophan synthase subunit alpha [Dehalogenimonas sp.]|uniref:Tryptophan synthase alpha chain n=1 Tax=Candidatus Dehalogenimonas loeffleri TaxID=3127115 RepID=A0ABZ2J294_9CHLR|nr:tryptophan synthase subunit alpha [Dehalogenimonas sp.]